MKNKNNVRGLGSALIGKKSYLFLHSADNAKQDTFTIRESDDGITFKTLTLNAKVVNINGPSDDFDQCGSFHMSKDGKIYYLTYYLCDPVTNENRLCIAQSTNLIDWEKINEIVPHDGNGKIVTEYLYAGRNVMYAGGDTLHMFVSEDMNKWSRAKKNLISLHDDIQKNNDDTDIAMMQAMYDANPDADADSDAENIAIVDAQIVDDGVFVMYSINDKKDGIVQHKIYGALFSYGDATKLVWQSQQPIYETHNSLEDQSTLFGAVVFDDYFVSYWTTQDGTMFLLRHYYKHLEDICESKNDEDPIVDDVADEPVAHVTLSRVPENPIMEPQSHRFWESTATYNPTAIESDGKIHIIYRADGNDLLSVWGYASTQDGITITDRCAQCIYHRNVQPTRKSFSVPLPYTSGGNSAGGCEDPRAVLVDGVVYITFTAFDGWGSVRVALTSIDLDDLKNKRWNWHKTRLISPPGEMNKNWVIFPAKINGKFAILHSYAPEIRIDYFDSLDELDGNTFIASNNTRPVDPTRGWDSWFRGVGPAPIKTREGWLVFFHAMDHKNPDRYRLGALLLDLDDPTKELYRSRGPILEPEASYENNGHKWGVIYCCGAVVKDGNIFVYYGGADKYVCVATAPLAQFLHDLKGTGEVRMDIN